MKGSKRLTRAEKQALAQAEIERTAAGVAHRALMRRLRTAKRGRHAHSHSAADVQFWCRAYGRAVRRLMAAA